MKKIISVLLTFAVMFALYSCDETRYFKSANWYVSTQVFKDDYIPKYEDKLTLLAEKYSLKHQKIADIREQDKSILFEVYLYNEEYTIEIVMRNDTWVASYDIVCHYYGYKHNDLNCDEMQENAIDFVNDFTNYAAYDTKTEENRLIAMYTEAYNSDDLRAFDKYHFDNYVGNVGYFVVLNNSSAGFYYMLKKDSNISVSCNSYGFEGILKPLE